MRRPTTTRRLIAVPLLLATSLGIASPALLRASSSVPLVSSPCEPGTRPPNPDSPPSSGGADRVPSQSTGYGDRLRAELVREAQRRGNEAREDERVLAEQYRSLPLAESQRRLVRASAELANLGSALSAAPPAASGGTAAWTQALPAVLNGADLASLGAEEAAQVAAGRPTELSRRGADTPASQGEPPFAFAPEGSGPKGPFTTEAPADSATGEARRYALLYGLPEDARGEVARRLNGFEPVSIPDGANPGRTAFLLRKGSRQPSAIARALGGRRVDCAALVFELLPETGSAEGATAVDFETMFTYLRWGAFPNPPVYLSARRTDLTKLARAFAPVDVYAGEPLANGDLVVVRDSPLAATVYIVMTSDAQTQVAKLQELPAMRRGLPPQMRTLPLRVVDAGPYRGALRPGLSALRVAPANVNRVCAPGTERGSK